MEEVKCPECNEWVQPKEERNYERADADGNRGIMIITLVCPLCDEDIEEIY